MAGGGRRRQDAGGGAAPLLPTPGMRIYAPLLSLFRCRYSFVKIFEKGYNLMPQEALNAAGGPLPSLCGNGLFLLFFS